jgi:hypothetical protein
VSGPDPVRKSLRLTCTPERAFAAFSEEISAWWPLRTHSLGGERALGVRIDGRVGGLIVETIDGADAAVWGTITVWDPPGRLACTWHPGTPEAEATHLDVRFSAEAGGTRMDLEHAGWERRESGGAVRDSYDDGWDAVLALYAGHLVHGGGVAAR